MKKRQNMTTNKYNFLRYIIITLLFLTVLACSTTKKAGNNSDEEGIISFKRIAKDIAQLEKEGFEFFVTLNKEYANLNKEDRPPILYVVSRFPFDNRCIAFVQTYRGFLSVGYNPLPLEDDKYSNLLLLYSKNGKNWKLDTTFTTYPDFYPIKESSNYFWAGSQRCIEGRCQWYNVILKVNENNQLEKIFDYENFNVEMYLEFILPDNRDAVMNRIGEEIKSETEIDYIWNWGVNELELQEIQIRETTGILQAVENDSLIIKTDSLFRTVSIKN